ncbi:MAG: dihydrolipoamide acetyltransferase family protein [Anaerolineales bacterium]|jgi:pyruvate dehydrogenase E2 component (dihydrolipoamide acetyltransferase)
MAEVVNMPKLGFDMAEGVLVRWVIAEDESVEKGEVLAEIETDKATVEVEASVSGTVLKHIVAEGTPVPVGEPIAVIGDAGEEVDLDELGAAQPAEAEQEAPAEEAAEPEAERAAPEAERSKETATTGEGQYPDGVKATPVARRIAEENKLNLKSIPGSGPGGRIVKADVEEALESGVPAEQSVPARQPVVSLPSGESRKTERVPVSKLRKTIGSRMSRSKQELPHFYVTIDVDAGPVMDIRKQINKAMPEDQKISVNDFLVKASALALHEFPNLNASLEEDEIVRHGQVNVGIAVAVDEGLLTVVARDADLKPLRTLSAEIRAMISRTREGKVRPDDVEGSTFTVSNLGMFDVDHFIAIINPPEAAILAVGSVREEPAFVDGELVPVKRLKVTLSADHRVTDGAEAARWLQVFREYIENPALLLI